MMAADMQSMERRWAVLAVVLSAPILAYAGWILRGFVQDDALIYLRVARIFLDFGNLGYNPEVRVEAFTGFFWQWLCIATLWADGPPLTVLKMVSLMFGLGSQWFLFRTAFRILKHPLWALAIPLIFAAYPPRVLWITSGLETEAFIFSVIWGAWMFLQAIEVPSPRSFWKAAPAFAFMVLNRPEAPILMAAAFLAMLSEARLRQAQYFLALLGLPIALYLILLLFRLSYFGLPFPNTFYAKEAGGIWLMKRGYYALKGFEQKNFNIFYSVFALMGWVYLWRDAKERSLPVFLAGWCLLFGLHFARSGGDLMPEERLLLPMAPAMLVSAGVFVKFLYDFLRQVLENFHGSLFFRLAPGLLFSGLFGGIGLWYFQKYPRAFGGHNEVLEALELCHADAGKIMQARARPGDKAVVTDAGMTAWVAPNVYFIDFLGLGDTTTSHIFYRNKFNPWAYEYCFWYPACDQAKKNTEKEFLAYFLREKPRWVVCNMIPGENTPAQSALREAIQNPPDTISAEIAQNIIMWQYFSVFSVDSIRLQYQPLKVYEYNPNYFLMLVEKRPL